MKSCRSIRLSGVRVIAFALFINAISANFLVANSNYSKVESSELFSKILEKRAPIEGLGIVVANIHDFAEDDQKVARNEYEVSDRLQIIAIVKSSVAESLGFELGDVIMELNGEYVPKGKDAIEGLYRQVISKLDGATTHTAMVIRNGYARTLKSESDSAD